MTRKASLAPAVVCGLLAVSFSSIALAGGGTKLQGKLQESDGGKVSMKVKFNRGAPSKITEIKVTNLPYMCTDGSTGSVDGKAGDANITYDADRQVFEFYGSYQAGPQTVISTSGDLSKNGKKASGGVQVAFPQQTPAGTVNCDTYSLGEKAGDFRAK
jgi:hypothetical protein